MGEKDLIYLIHKLLLKKQKTIAVAESCSAGGLSYLLTSFPNSSAYFIMGLVAYSNRIKKDVLKIPLNLLIKKGAVSRPVAEKMAQGIKRIARTDLGIGITGIAGPGGASPGKPVGTVFIAIVGRKKKYSKKFFFKGERNSIRKQSCLKALGLLKKFI